MTGLRTLPFHREPIPGEALDSWLETLAHLHAVRYVDLLRHLGLDHRTRRWVITLRADEIRTIARCAGIDAEQLPAMTLERYDGTALQIDRTKCQIARSYGWEWVQRSRFCPYCLAETGGRWQLAWRLRWTFACPMHRCVLADTCPSCGCLTRTKMQPQVVQVPRPGLRPHRCRDEAHNPADICHGDLSAQKVATLGRNHPILRAQAYITDIIESTPSRRTGQHPNGSASAAETLLSIKTAVQQALSTRETDICHWDHSSGSGSTTSECTSAGYETSFANDQSTPHTALAIALALTTEPFASAIVGSPKHEEGSFTTAEK